MFTPLPPCSTTRFISSSSSYCSFSDASFQAHIHLRSFRTGLRFTPYKAAFLMNFTPSDDGLTPCHLRRTQYCYQAVLIYCLEHQHSYNSGAHVCMTAQPLWGIAESPEEKEKINFSSQIGASFHVLSFFCRTNKLECLLNLNNLEKTGKLWPAISSF